MTTSETNDHTGVLTTRSGKPVSEVFAWDNDRLVILDSDVAKALRRKALSASTAKATESQPARWAFEKALTAHENPFDAAPLGTSAHSVMEDLFALKGKERTQDKAMSILLAHSKEMWPGKDEESFAKRGLWISEVHAAYKGLWDIEDPRTVSVFSREFSAEGIEVAGVPFIGYIDRVDITPDGYRVVDYKGLAVDTPIPTPDGWTTMGDLRVGDQVLGTDGHPTTVTVKSRTHHRKCYRITFSDGSTVVCDNVHLWEVTELNPQGQHTTSVLDADALADRFETLRAAGRPNSLVIPNAAPLEFPEADLPIDPWMLGAWLGDGTASSAGITVGHQDIDDMLSLIKERWGHASHAVYPNPDGDDKHIVTPGNPDGSGSYFRLVERPDAGPIRYRGKRYRGGFATEPATLRGLLNRHGLLDNKHVPAAYLRASVAQRLDLLRGLMDTDGSWNPTRKRAVFANSNEALADAVAELALSLGVTVQRFKTWVENKTRPSGWTYKVEFRPVGFNPFSLPRKAVRVDEYLASMTSHASILATRRHIKSIERVESVPTQCIKVDAPNALYLCGPTMVPTHNTSKKMPANITRFGDDHGDQMRLYSEVIRVHPDFNGELPAEAMLYYTRLGKSRSVPLSKQKMRETLTKFSKAWTAHNKYVDEAAFPCKPTALCGWCPLVNACPIARADDKVDRTVTENGEPAAPTRAMLGIPTIAPYTGHTRKVAVTAPDLDLDFGSAALDDDFGSAAEDAPVVPGTVALDDDFGSAAETSPAPVAEQAPALDDDFGSAAPVAKPVTAQPAAPAEPEPVTDDFTFAAPVAPARPVAVPTVAPVTPDPDRDSAGADAHPDTAFDLPPGGFPAPAPAISPEIAPETGSVRAAAAHIEDVDHTTPPTSAGTEKDTMSNLLGESKPWDETVNGRLNPGSYAATAVFGTVTLAYEELNKAGVPVTKDNIDGLAATLAGIVSRAQVKLTGQDSFQEGSNTRLRGVLRTVIDAHPLPWGGDMDAWNEWVALVEKHTGSLASAAIRLYESDPQPQPWQALALREAHTG